MMSELAVPGCRIDPEPQECVLADGARDLCLYAAEITRPHECPFWSEEDSQSESHPKRKRRHGQR